MIESTPPLTQQEEDAFLAEIKAQRLAAQARQREAAEAQRLERVTVKPAPVVTVEHKQTECGMCGQLFSSFVFRCGEIAMPKLYCEPCVEAYMRDIARLSAPAPRQGASDAWLALCEPEFRTLAEGGRTDPLRLARECPLLPQIEGWPFGPKGLMIRGQTGACKTRAVWRLLRVQFDAGRSIVATSSGRFARECQDAAGRFALSEWFDRLALVDVLFVDDLGKAKWTEFVWAQFFELIDERAKHGRPFIITTNETRKTLEAKCADPVTWLPLIRRIDENTLSLSL